MPPLVLFSSVNGEICTQRRGSAERFEHMKKKQDGSKTGHTQVTLIKYREEIFDISWATAYLFRVLKL